MPDVVVPAMSIEEDAEWRAGLIELCRLVHHVRREGFDEGMKVGTARWHTTMAAKLAVRHRPVGDGPEAL